MILLMVKNIRVTLDMHAVLFSRVAVCTNVKGGYIFGISVPIHQYVLTPADMIHCKL